MAVARITTQTSWWATGMAPQTKIRKQTNKKMKKSLKISIGAAVLCCVASLVSTAAAQNGTWTAYPGQSTTYHAAVQQPINADGSSKFKANGHAVIPIKFALSQATGPFVFESTGLRPATNTRPELYAEHAGDVQRHRGTVSRLCIHRR